MNTLAATAQAIPIALTNYFSPLMVSYAEQNPALTPFYSHAPQAENIEKIIILKQQTFTNRKVLVDALHQQYQGMELSTGQKKNLQALESSNCFSITCAHQPNIFLGPLYFVYKIIQSIAMADFCNQRHPTFHFVPIFYMGSEDADKQELNHITINQTVLKWTTEQTGAFGRMKIDNAFMGLITKITGEIGVLPFGKNLIALLTNCYQKGAEIQTATLKFIHALFQDYGLLVVVPDSPLLKQCFIPIAEKELKTFFSHQAVAHSCIALEKLGYKPQAWGRDINLFYLIENKRERIIFKNNRFEVENLGIKWSLEAILKELHAHPERFSPNVILRGLFQETILPNIAFIGGGGEIAYWLEFKYLFEQAAIPLPMLIVRNSYLLIGTRAQQITKKFNLSASDIFLSTDRLIKKIIYTRSNYADNFILAEEQIVAYFEQLQKQLSQLDKSLEEHTKALQAKMLKDLYQLEQKTIRSLKQQQKNDVWQIHALKNNLFPLHNLQERVESFLPYYASYGKDFFSLIKTHNAFFAPTMYCLNMLYPPSL